MGATFSFTSSAYQHKTISATTSISLQNRLDEIGMNTWAESLISTKERGVDNKKKSAGNVCLVADNEREFLVKFCSLQVTARIPSRVRENS